MMNKKLPMIYIIFSLLFIVMFGDDGEGKHVINNILISLLFCIYLLHRVSESSKYKRLIKKYTLIKTTNEKLIEDLHTDPLTLAYNRRALTHWFKKNAKRLNEEDSQFSIIFFDIDNFKTINDTYGHEQGDNVLINLSKEIKSLIRKDDFLVRMGGEEFCFFSFEGKEESLKIAERIRKQVKNITYGNKEFITCSLGVSQYKKEEGLNQFISRADYAMYSAKNSGKDKVCFA